MERRATAGHGPDPVGWSRRYRANLGRLRSGEPDQIAEVVRERAARERATGISAGERRMLARARRMLDNPGSAGAGEPHDP